MYSTEFIDLSMKLNSIVLLLVFFNFCTISKNNNSNVNSIKLTNSEAKSFLLSDTSHINSSIKFFVIYNSTNCKDCFKQIEETLKEIKLKNKSSKVFVITTINRLDTYTTRYKKSLALEKIPSADNVFFEVATQEGLFEYTYPENGIFKTYNITITPSILRYKNGKLEYFPYESIFKNGGYDDSWFSK